MKVEQMKAISFQITELRKELLQQGNPPEFIEAMCSSYLTLLITLLAGDNKS